VSHIVRVALDTPLRRLFDYLPPLQPSVPPAPGARVRIPFGRQRRVGIVAELSGHSEVSAARLKPVLEVLDPTPVLDAALLALLHWAADYYHHAA
jgi:primosomal protein N' (replication factor Y) (superfamily II helicase)